MKRILIVDDDALLRDSLGFHFEQAGYHPALADNAERALELARQDQPDLVVLDIGLPGMDGLQALKVFREELARPVILLTARRRSGDEVLGLELGADDYVTKPFDPDVLLSHVKAVLRRAARPHEEQAEPGRLQVGDLALDPATQRTELDGQPVELTGREFSLLYALASTPGQVTPVDELSERAWGTGQPVERHVVYVHLRWLREKIEADPDRPRRIITVRGIGYRYDPQEPRNQASTNRRSDV